MNVTWWLAALLALNIILLLFNLIVSYLVGSGIVKSQETLNKSMKILSDQMTDLEEKNSDMHKDVRKTAQYFVNFAKGLKSNQFWYNQF